MGLAGSPLRFDVVRAGLETKRLGKTIHYLPAVDSTNNFARQRAEQGGAEGEVVIGETQTEGRGRMGRNWISPPCVNLYLSVILRPRLAAVDVPQITLMAAVALADTVGSFIAVRPEIKWPNDILVEGKKLAGVLTESSCEGQRVAFVILGIGINVNFPPEAMPDLLRERATSLMVWARGPISREECARRLIHSLDRCYGELEEGGFSAIAPRWEAYFRLKGKKVRVEMVTQAISGTVLGIDRDGTLMLEDDCGGAQRVIAGDVIPMEG